MSSSQNVTRRPAPAAPEREARVGLRVRIWAVGLGTGALAGFGSLWVLGTRVQPGAVDVSELLAWLSGVAFLSVIAGVALSAWLDHHVVGHLRGVLRGIQSGRITELRGLPGAGGWGELSELSEAVQDMLVRERAQARAAEDLEQLRGQLAALQAAVERWLATESWETPRIEHGLLAPLNDSLARGFSRRSGVDDQNREAARQVAAELAASLADAQESAEQAERGFVEATAMLTTVRELQRLSTELQVSLDAVGALSPGAADAPPTGAREAIEELVVASQESVASIGRGMLRVHDVSEQVQQLANRATLIAIHAVSSAGATEGDDRSQQLKQLARDVREATDRTAQFAHEIESAVADAGTRMRDARERAMVHLDVEPREPAAPIQSSRAYDDAQRLLERVREMVQDAARKGERLSAAGERASRAAERLSRRVDDSAEEATALQLRLAPVGSPGDDAGAPELRLLEELRRGETHTSSTGDAADDDARTRREEERPS